MILRVHYIYLGENNSPKNEEREMAKGKYYLPMEPLGIYDPIKKCLRMDISL